MTRKLAAAALAALLLPAALPVSAAEPAEALADCLYKNTSGTDRDVFVQWAFVTIGKTEAAKSITAISDSKRKSVEQKAQSTLTRVVMKSCPKESMQLLLKDPKKGLENTLLSLAQKLVTEELSRRSSPILNLTITDLLKR
ncbi:hypothetical protein [Sutterella sp.]|uniref:hypothetical protein n=1 Tax=Sutterella sp. TaxID=1981025 RepID=UPI0026DF789C|nr:hypothetical protein [Sutterella sp.]MDO5531192.1 hypothetical protein [Sutterella sp.]